MKKLLLILFVFTCLVSPAQNIPAAPNPPRLVNDFAHVMTSDQVQELEEKLVAYDDSTSDPDRRDHCSHHRGLCH